MTNISGTVLTEKGFAVENAMVVIANRIASTDNMGRFCLCDVPIGTAYVVIEHRDYDQYIEPVVIDNDQPDLIMTLSPITKIASGS